MELTTVTDEDLEEVEEATNDAVTNEEIAAEEIAAEEIAAEAVGEVSSEVSVHVVEQIDDAGDIEVSPAAE